MKKSFLTSRKDAKTQSFFNLTNLASWRLGARFLSLLIFLQPLTVSAESGISATLNHDTIALGGSATLTLIVRGNDLGNIALPQVDGLQFEQIGMSRRSGFAGNFSFSFGGGASGAASQGTIVEVALRVVPQRDGTFTIPPFSCAIDGKTFATQPLTLKALKDSAAAQQFARAAAPPASASAAAPSPAPESNELIFGKITGVPEKMYVGQVAPATVTFYINRRANIQLRQLGLPALKHDAFATPLLRPEQVRQQEDEQYLMFSAVVPLTALKEGGFELAAEWPLTVLVTKDNDPSETPQGIPPLSRNILQMQVQKSVVVNSDKLAVKVLPLPADGRPASYSGAIGEFTASVSAEPREVRVGDPLTVRLSVSGRGNFDRIAAPAPPDATGWKTYPASGQFAAADSAGLEGVKTFSLPLIPQSDIIKQIPNIEFSYFDPLTVKYITLRPELPMVTILPAEKNSSATAAAVSSSAAANDDQPALAPLRLEFGAACDDLCPVTARAWFWGANSLPLLLGVAGFLLLRRHRQTQDADYQARKQTDRNVARALQTLDAALANEDSAAFAESASRVLRERLAAAWNQRAESLTTADVRSRLGADGQPVLALFETADAVTYAGRRLSRDEMMDFRQRLAEQLNRLGV